MTNVLLNCITFDYTKNEKKMKTFKNNNFTKRNYDFTNIVFCQTDIAPDLDWIECNESEIVSMNCNHLFSQSGVRYFGYL